MTDWQKAYADQVHTALRNGDRIPMPTGGWTQDAMKSVFVACVVHLHQRTGEDVDSIIDRAKECGMELIRRSVV